MTTPFQLFSALDAATKAALTESIKRFGVLVPVVRDQHGNVLDGHHRAAIADELGVKYPVSVLNVADEDEGRAIAVTLNADRRQLDAAQRREVVQHLRAQGHSQRATADALGVGLGTVQRDEAQLTRAGQLTVPPATRGRDGKTRTSTPKRPTHVVAKDTREADRAQDALAILGDDAPERVIDVKRAERMGREKQAEQRRAEPVPVSTNVDVDLRHGDFRSVLASLPPSSVDAIISDPPYPRNFVDLFDPLGDHAARILKPGGVLAVLVGHLHLRAYMDSLDEHLAYRWVGAYVMPGARARVHPARVSTGWKPVLLYERKDAVDTRALVDDVIVSTGDDKRHHHWGQNESAFGQLVERLTRPGDLVVDPFLGGGTTAVVCRDLGRRFIGCDVDAAAVHTSRERVA